MRNSHVIETNACSSREDENLICILEDLKLIKEFIWVQLKTVQSSDRDSNYDVIKICISMLMIKPV